jgi:hypothetical protein
MREAAFASSNGQVVVELFVKAKLHCGHRSWPLRHGRSLRSPCCFNR